MADAGPMGIIARELWLDEALQDLRALPNQAYAELPNAYGGYGPHAGGAGGQPFHGGARGAGFYGGQQQPYGAAPAQQPYGASGGAQQYQKQYQQQSAPAAAAGGAQAPGQTPAQAPGQARKKYVRMPGPNPEKTYGQASMELAKARRERELAELVEKTPWLRKAREEGLAVDDLSWVRPSDVLKTRDGKNRRAWYTKEMLLDRMFAPIDRCVGQEPRSVEHQVKWMKWQQKSAGEKVVKAVKETPKVIASIPLVLIFALFAPGPPP